jgi:hypothetical protein
MNTPRPLLQRRIACIASSLAAALLVALLTLICRPANLAVDVRYICLTNDAAHGRAALLCITNQADYMVICARMPVQMHSRPGGSDMSEDSAMGLACLEPGESLHFVVPAPAGTGPWRVPVKWQRRELKAVEQLIDRQRDRLLRSLGRPTIIRGDPWFRRKGGRWPSRQADSHSWGPWVGMVSRRFSPRICVPELYLHLRI